MTSLSHDEKLILVQHAISKYDSEVVLKEKLNGVLPAKEVERLVDTLIATQKVRRIGSETLQNNISHVGELPDAPDSLSEILARL